MDRMRRGHRLHSIVGLDELSLLRLGRARAGALDIDPDIVRNELEFFDAICRHDSETISSFKEDSTKTSSFSCDNWDFIKRCAKAVASTGNVDILKTVVNIFIGESAKPTEIGEIFALETISSGKPTMVTGLLQNWFITRTNLTQTPLDVKGTSKNYATTRKLQNTETLALVESVIYCSTVDQQSEVLESVLKWHDFYGTIVGESVKLNADCIIHATLEDDKEILKILYTFGYRLGPDTDRRINKDYLKRIKLFRARASPIYNIVAFEDSHDIDNFDPLKKCFEYAWMARRYASKIQDFTKEYMDIAQKCECFAKGLLDRCTTKHEVETLLQTRSYAGHTDANFNIAILDGHKEFVAHEKFQQILHKKWGQRDRNQWKHTPSYNILWSEKNALAKVTHVFQQIFVFLLLPFVVLTSTTFFTAVESCTPLGWFIRQSQIPVNRFLYWEMSKLIFYGIVFCTLMDEDVVAWYDMLAAAWIVSYLLENIRTIHRLYRYSGHGRTGPDGSEKSQGRIFKRWLTFRNIYILATDLVFLISLILRCLAHFNNQCRRGCPYEGNEIAFFGAAIWAIAAVLTFLRSIQGGLMWRQTGPIIISMSYMILDVAVFLFIFVIVYISFTLAMVYVYAVYSDDRASQFNTHKMAFKLFFWAMIRPGNPQFADIHVRNASNIYNTTCLKKTLDSYQSVLIGVNVSRLEIDEAAFTQCVITAQNAGHVEEGISYVAGNILWAVYQFTVVVVLLSILRARMVNTYQRIFKEADVQWKFFRACIWWKYLDEHSVLPPPYTAFYFMIMGVKYLSHSAALKVSTFRRRSASHAAKDTPTEFPIQRREREHQEQLAVDKCEFHKRYKRLMLMLVNW